VRITATSSSSFLRRRARRVAALLLAGLLVGGADAVSAQSGRTTTLTLPGDVGLDLVWVEAGRYRMGAPEGEDFEDPPVPDETPDHSVVLTRGFWIGRTEVTQAQWAAVVATRPWVELTSPHIGPDRPAVFLSWFDAVEFADSLNAWHGTPVFRLPTEAEWEYACRAGTTGRWYTGDAPGRVGDAAWYRATAWDAGQRWPHDVGQLQPNAWGLFDMLGNAEEWVSDWYDSGYYDRAPERDPAGPERGSTRVLRGGNFADEIDAVTSSGRDHSRADIRSSLFGLRIVADDDLVTAVRARSWGQVKDGSTGP
jgi:formylglycine-generating enzyme required for sulfatase activity